ncbi:MAG TPA: porin family protein [Sulfurovum sp.]|uniref:porin family protein n=1 Tax=Sulfurovum sp. TaxID=1969726 RepID=UPI002F94F565
MKKVIKTLTLGATLATGNLFGGGDIAPAVAPIGIEEIDPNPLYIGVGALWVDVTRDCECLDLLGNPRIGTRLEDTTWGGIVRLGYDYNQYFGIEARALKALYDSDTFDVTHYGIFLKPMMPIGEQFNVYGLIGYGYTKVETTCGTLRETYSENGMHYGIGLEYDLSDRDSDKEEGGVYDRPFDGHGDQEKGWGLFVDYQNLLHDSGPIKYRANVVSFGITYDF